MLGGAGSPGGGGGGAGGAAEEQLLTVTIVRDEHGYGMKVSGDNPVYVQSVKEHGAAWRAGLRAGDRILRVGTSPVLRHTHQQVVHMIRANPTTVLTVQQNTSRHKTPITAPVPVNSEKQRQLEVSKIQTVRLMLEQEQKYIRDLRNELSKVPDVRKQAQLESAEQRCSILQHEIDGIMAGQPDPPSTPHLAPRTKTTPEKISPPPNTGFLSGLPRSLSNLTGQSLRNLRQRQNKQQENQPPLLRQNSDENTRRKHLHNNTVPMVPTTCLDNVTPPPLPPRSTERPKRNPLSPTSPPPVNPLAKPKPCTSASPIHNYYPKPRYNDPKNFPMHQSMPAYNDNPAKLRRSSHSLDGELDGPQPNSIALQMSYPLVNAPPPPLQTDNRGNVPVLHVRSQSSPEHLDHELTRSAGAMEKEAWARGTPPPGTPPPPYAHNTQPCADPQRAIISMEEDDSPASDNSTYSGLFSNLRSVRDSKARTAVLLNWLLGERRCACANLLLVITDGYRAATGVTPHTLRRWAYEIQSTFLIPNAVLQLNGVDENMANEIEQVLVNEYDKEELLRNVFRKARQKAKEELTQQLSEFQVKRQVGLGTLYGPEDAVLEKCDVDKAQEQVVVERLLCGRLTAVASGAFGGCGTAGPGGGGGGGAGPAGGGPSSAHAHTALVAALIAAALCLQCRPASVAAAVGGQRSSFLQRDKLYKQRVKQLAKQHAQPFIVRGHHLQLQALTSVAHCHHCEHVISGLAPQAYVCTDCKLRVHRACAKSVFEGCCLDGEHHNNRISRFMERIHNAPNNQDSSDKKARKSSGAAAAAFLNMELRARRAEDEPAWDHTLTPTTATERRDESDESLYESADCHSDAISASDDALPGLIKTPTMSKESLKLAVTDEEVEVTVRNKKGHRKAMSLSHPLEVVKTFSDEWFESKKDIEKLSDKKKSRESLWSEEDKESVHGSAIKLDQSRKDSKKENKSVKKENKNETKENKSESNSRKSSTADPPKRKPSKTSSVSALSFLRRKKTPTSIIKPVEVVAEVADKIISSEELLNYTKLFLEEEKRYSAIRESKPIVDTDSDDEPPTPKVIDHRRRLSRQASRSKSKARGKSQSVKVNTLRKSHSGTLKKAKKKSAKTTPTANRSRQASIIEQTPILKKKSSDHRQHSWLFSGSRGEARREGSTEDTTAVDADGDADHSAKDVVDKDNNWRSPGGGGGGRGVNRAESCRERDAPRRGKHRNASDPNRLTALNHTDLEPGAATAPSGSSSSSSLSSRSNESNTVAADQHASASEWSDEEEPLCAQWADSLPPRALDSMTLSPRLRKRQEVIHELIVSEGSHVRWLKVLGGIFLRPLEAQPTLLPPDELRALFPNLPGVRERHAKLYADLRGLRSSSSNHYVQIRPVADIMLNTLGEAGYAPCLARFCRGQRMALDALRERRRKSKELQQFLSAREQLPVCGRLQLRDLLACVWQRLTKYQLLLEGILNTVSEDPPAGEEPDCPEDTAVLKRALDVAKEVLHSVDTAIRTAENEHRLRSIQSKLEIRIACGGSEWEEAKRLDLTHHKLRMEGELAIRNDSNKKMNVLALMLEDCLVLLQREGDKFVLRPITQPSQQGLLSPLIKWERVLFRPNAAVRNAFFLMNINCIQMHELSATTHTEYQTWVRHMEELPLAKPELRPTLTPSHQPSRSTDDSGINVSRNPSDASEKSTSSAADDECERDRASADRAPDRDGASRGPSAAGAGAERDGKPLDRRDDDKEEKHKSRRPTVGRISTHAAEPAPSLLEPSAALTVQEPVASSSMHTAHTAYTYQERLRRLDEGLSSALRAKSEVVCSLLGIPPAAFAHMAELAIADTLGQVDVSGELRAAGLSRESSVEEGPAYTAPSAPPALAPAPAPDMHQLLLAAQAQANQLTETLGKALTVNEAAAVAARVRGRCDSCRRRGVRGGNAPGPPHPPADPSEESKLDDGIEIDASPQPADAPSERGAEPGAEDALESNAGAAALASRLVGVACGLQGSLGALLAALPALHAERLAARREILALREHNDRLRAKAGFPVTDEISFPTDCADQTIQDQPSNGG